MNFSQHIGRSRGGNTTKIHAVVDAMGNPLMFQLKGGQVHDSKPTLGLLETIALEGIHVLGDKVYGAQEIRYLTSRKASYTIPPRTNAKKTWFVDWFLYKEHHVVECFFNKIKHFHRVATR
ncbi:Transposase DDE domain protein [compost metagenome]